MEFCGTSCFANLLQVLDEATREVDEGMQAKLSFPDFSRALDLETPSPAVNFERICVIDRLPKWIVEISNNNNIIYISIYGRHAQSKI